jgi:hypothetical protein
MSRAAAFELAEALDVLEGDGQVPQALVGGVDRLDAGEMHMAYSSMEAWPTDRTKRSRLVQIGSSGSKRGKCCHRV